MVLSGSDLGHTLTLKIYQRWCPCTGSEDHLFGVILSAIDCLNTNTCRPVGGQERLFEGTSPVIMSVQETYILVKEEKPTLQTQIARPGF